MEASKEKARRAKEHLSVAGELVDVLASSSKLPAPEIVSLIKLHLVRVLDFLDAAEMRLPKELKLKPKPKT